VVIGFVMANDSIAQFDQTVLDMIEHSPTGMAPHTPAYVDALGRLQGSHQIYASADHKGGHVTARSLAQHPVFHANNLESLLKGAVDIAELEPNPGIFDRYVQSLPAAHRAAAEGYRLKAAGRPVHHRVRHHETAPASAGHDWVHSLFLVPGGGPHPGLPGNYLYGSLFEFGTDASSTAWAVQLHDSDDGVAVSDGTTLAEALARFQDVIASAPFHLSELEALGFQLK
jgi:hypothetical protein